MNNYPQVIGEYETLEELHKGRSIARYGDGEIKVCERSRCVSQVYHVQLTAEMRRILASGSSKNCLIAIPPMDNPNITKQHFWDARMARRINRLTNKDGIYYSSFITRSDNAPWINEPNFWNSLVDLWSGKDVTLVLGSERSLCERNMEDARSVTYVWGPRRDAYDEIGRIQDDIINAGNKIVILCLGCTATVLAWRLSEKFQALDLGHAGLKSMFKKGRGLE